MTKEMKISGIKLVCGETKDLHGYYSGEYLEVFYDMKADKMWSIFHWSLGHNQWTHYDDEDIVRVGNICGPCTMKELRKYTIEAIMNCSR